jgi:AcrR family transcriptional regulator
MKMARRAKRRIKSGRRQRRSAEIIDAAARVFAERGFHGASTQDIADVLGVRQASVYYYFPSKEVALEMVCARGVEGFVENAIRVTERKASAADKLAGLIQSHVAPLRERPDYVKVFLNERRHLPAESRRRIGRLSRAVERIFEDVIRSGVQRREFRAGLDPRLATLAILGMVNAVASWIGKSKGVTIERISAQFAALVLAGVARKRTK